MQIRRGTFWLRWPLAAGLTLAFAGASMADDVQLDRISGSVRARLEQVQTQLAARQWPEAVENLRQIAEITDGSLVAVSEGRFVDLREWCQRRLAALPPEALGIYRGQVDPAARRWYEEGVARRDRRLLQQVVDRALASSYGDDALLALGDIHFEVGDFSSARRYWRRILPPEEKAASDSLSPYYPDTDLDPATVAARLVLVSILEGRRSRARTELTEFARLYPDSQGRLGERQGKYVDLLESLLTESATWPPVAADPDWPTFAGNPRRNKSAAPVGNIGGVSWRISLGERAANSSPLPLGEGPGVRALRFHPLLYTPQPDDPSAAKQREEISNKTDAIVLLNTQREILALRLDDGRPAWGRSAAIYRGETDTAGGRAMRRSGSPQFTMTVFRNRLYARMGSPLDATDEPGSIVCLDLAAEGRLAWKAEAEDGWAFEGSPLADDRGVYVGMRRPGVRRRAFVACLEPETGRDRWRRFVCAAETPASGNIPECCNNLLTLAEGTLYYNTNLGAVAAVRVDNGRIEWISLYPRTLGGDIDTPGPQRRELNPCLFERGTLYVAPADSPSIFAFDAGDGRMLWKTDAATDALDLLGATEDHLIAAGGRIYWIGLAGAERGRAVRAWPEDGGLPCVGRGALAGRGVLWTTPDKLYIFDPRTAAAPTVFDLAARGASGGNLLVSRGKILIAAENAMIALEAIGEKRSIGKSDKKN